MRYYSIKCDFNCCFKKSRCFFIFFLDMNENGIIMMDWRKEIYG